MQQTVVNTTVKVVDSLYSGHAMAEKWEAASYVKIRIECTFQILSFW